MKGLAAMVFYGGFAMSLSYASVTPIFYSELLKRGIDFIYNGFFIIYACPFIILQPQVSLLIIHSIGLLNTFIVGALCLGSATITFTLLYLVTSPSAFLISALISRFAQGVGSALMMVASFSILPYLFPKHVSRVTTIFIATSSLGVLFSDQFSQEVQATLGTPGPFWLSGSLVLYGALIGCSYSLPRDRRSIQQLRTVNSSSLLQSRFSASLALNYFLFSFLLTFQSTFLISQKQDPDVQMISPFFILQLSAFAITSLLLPLLPQKYNKTTLLVPSNVLLAVGLSLMSPSPELGESNVKVIVIIGLNISGIASAVRIGITQQEILHHSYNLFPGRWRDLAALVAGLRAFIEGLALLFGPMAAIIMAKYLLFGHAMQILAITLFVGAFIDIWLLFGIVPAERPRQPPNPNLPRAPQNRWLYNDPLLGNLDAFLPPQPANEPYFQPEPQVQGPQGEDIEEGAPLLEEPAIQVEGEENNED